jgi:hypothetical protein
MEIANRHQKKNKSKKVNHKSKQNKVKKKFVEAAWLH